MYYWSNQQCRSTQQVPTSAYTDCQTRTQERGLGHLASNVSALYHHFLNQLIKAADARGPTRMQPSDGLLAESILHGKNVSHHFYVLFNTRSSGPLLGTMFPVHDGLNIVMAVELYSDAYSWGHSFQVDLHFMECFWLTLTY